MFDSSGFRPIAEFGGWGSEHECGQDNVRNQDVRKDIPNIGDLPVLHYHNDKYFEGLGERGVYTTPQDRKQPNWPSSLAASHFDPANGLLAIHAW